MSGWWIYRGTNLQQLPGHNIGYFQKHVLLVLGVFIQKIKNKLPQTRNEWFWISAKDLYTSPNILMRNVHPLVWI